MSTRRISRYILAEAALPSLLGLAIFTFVLMMGSYGSMVEMIIQRGVPPREMLAIFIRLLPSLLIITLPFSFLLGILLAFGRLSGDGEIIAMKSCGISLFRFSRPVMLLALLVTLVTAVLTFDIQPRWKYLMRKQIFTLINNQATAGIQPQVFNQTFDGMTLYTEEIDPATRTLSRIFIADERGDTPATIFADRGQILSDPEAGVVSIRLEQGSIHRRPDREGGYQTIGFRSYIINLDISRQMAANKKSDKKAREMTITELRDAYHRTKDPKGEKAILIRLHSQLAAPFAPLLFALIAIPLGIQTSRSGKSGGVAVAMALALIYYFLLTLCQTLAEGSSLPPALLIWLPNLAALVIGITLFTSANHEKIPRPILWVLNGIDRVKAFRKRLEKDA